MLDGCIRSSETFASLTYRQRDLWQGLIVVADDQGRLRGAPALVRSQVWPYDDISLSDVETDLQRLAELGNILRYEVDGHQYLQLVNWWRYQHPQWVGLSDYPTPPGWTDRGRYHIGREVVTVNWPSRQTTDHVGSDVPSDVPFAGDEMRGDEMREASSPRRKRREPTPDNSESTPLLVVDSLDDKSALDKTRREETRLESAPSGASISGPIPQREMFGALAQVCQSDQNLERGKLGTLSNADRAELEAYFCELTYLDPPKYGTEKERKAAGVRWVTPLREIYKKADGDMGRAKALIQEALADLDGMTIEAPASILKTVKGIVAKEKRGDASGRLQPKPPATTPAIYQNPDGTWFMPVGGHDARR